MPREIIAPGKHRYGEGWMVDKWLNGKEAFTQGHFMLVGKPPRGKRSEKSPNLSTVARKCLGQVGKAKRLRILGDVKRTYVSGLTITAIKLGKNQFIQRKYDHFIRSRYPNAEYWGRDVENLPVLIYSKERFVGAIMGLRL